VRDFVRFGDVVRTLTASPLDLDRWSWCTFGHIPDAAPGLL
jgi:hypothetical protein